MTAQVDSREPTNFFATDRTFYTITRAASKKISKIRRRISGRNPGANSLTSDSEYITSSKNTQQKEKVNPFQQEDFYFTEQSTNYKQESPKMENDLLINNEESYDFVTQDLHYTDLTDKEIEQSSTNEQPLKRNSSLGKVKNAVKRFASIRYERKRNSEAYHQDGKTNPFE
ncbi:hypothetical protein F8M41_002513 [Gigaspora margarita]|uniref:Uncharacterized protein n=1 Tax=Gigaspora margarita TaxID=4874 RepID=A0A8H3XCQ4_GIGMA|nr:hypothetical protein F8M41_002513 [Gigaspora margarita]